MNVLSLFDGMSGAQQALDRNGVKVSAYFSSEIDKYAMQVTRKNYPDTNFVGSVVDLDVNTLPQIDFLVGGSPCQGFSFAGKRKGSATKCDIEITTLKQYLDLKDNDFEFEGQSYLFWEYVRIYQELKEVNPDIKFLLENVKMIDKWSSMFNEAIGVKSIELNSSLVSAQNRIRFYWTNIIQKKQIEDLKLTLDDVLLTDFVYDSSKIGTCELRDFKESSVCHHIANTTDINGNETIKRVYALSGKSPTLTTMQGGHRQPKVYLGNNTYRKMITNEFEILQTVRVGYTSIGMTVDMKEVQISDSQRNKMLGNGFTIDIISSLTKGLENG